MFYNHLYLICWFKNFQYTFPDFLINNLIYRRTNFVYYYWGWSIYDTIQSVLILYYFWGTWLQGKKREGGKKKKGRGEEKRDGRKGGFPHLFWRDFLPPFPFSGKKNMTSLESCSSKIIQNWERLGCVQYYVEWVG